MQDHHVVQIHLKRKKESMFTTMQNELS